MISHFKKKYAEIAICAVLLSGCSHDAIPNTTIEDTEENRSVLEFVDSYRRAVESRDIGQLLALTSLNYFDDMGTPIGDDDVDYETLKKGLERLKKEVLEARYQINFRSVTYVDSRALVDFLYTGWYRINASDGPQWRRVLTNHRLVVAMEDGRYKITSGL
jgi:hypothetical protein